MYNHIIAIRTYNRVKSFKQFLESLPESISHYKGKSRLYLLILDCSNEPLEIENNKRHLNIVVKNLFVKTEYYNFEKNNNLINIVNKFSDKQKSLLKFTNSYNYLFEIINNSLSFLLLQILAIKLLKEYNLEDKKTLVSFYDDDVQLKIIDNYTEKSFNTIQNKDLILQNNKLFSYGKYLHHHGNPFVDLERSLISLNLIIENCNILNDFNAIKHTIYLNNKYKVLSSKELLQYIPDIIRSIYNRSSIISPIFEEHYLDKNKAKLTFDLGNFSIRGDLLKILPFHPLGNTEPFMLSIYKSVFPEFSNLIEIEPAIIHRHPVHKNNKYSMSRCTIDNILRSPIYDVFSSINTCVQRNKKELARSLEKILDRKISTKLIDENFQIKKYHSNHLNRISNLQLSTKYLIEKYYKNLPTESQIQLDKITANPKIQDENQQNINNTYIKYYLELLTEWKSLINIL